MTPPAPPPIAGRNLERRCRILSLAAVAGLLAVMTSVVALALLWAEEWWAPGVPILILDLLCLGLLAWFLARFLVWWPRKPAGIPIVLMLHSVGEAIAEPTAPNNSIRPAALDRLVADLQASGYAFRTLSEACSTPCPPRTIVLTFDDGFADNHANLLPILLRRRVPATIFATDRQGHDFLTDAQIREMADTGLVEFGGHTAGHVHLPALPEADARREIAANKRRLETLLGHPIHAFAYPFGEFGEREEALAREAGYRHAVTTRKRGPWGDPLRIPRQIIPRDTPPLAAYLLATRGKSHL